jgi:hypothetical protein
MFQFVTENEGIPPLRLTEPITSLQLTPFALKAARSTGVKNVGELATFIWQKEGKGLGQGHIEEIRRKIEQFVGKPPFLHEHIIDWTALLRLALSPLESTDKSILVTYTQVQSLVPLSPQETKEAQILLHRNAKEKFQDTLIKAQKKTIEVLQPLTSTVFKSLVKPLILKRGGVVHSLELNELLLEHGTISSYPLFDKTICLLESLLGQTPLFLSQLYHVPKSFWAISPSYQRLANTVLEDAHSLLKKETPTNLHSLAYVLARYRMSQWDAWPIDAIKRLLFWQFLNLKDHD